MQKKKQEINYESKKQIKKAILLMKREFPILKSTNIKIKVGRMPFRFRKSLAITGLKYNMESPFFGIVLNEKCLYDASDHNLFTTKEIVVFNRIEDIIIHELGHVLHHIYVAKKLNIGLGHKLTSSEYNDIVKDKNSYLKFLIEEAFSYADYSFDLNMVEIIFGKNVADRCNDSLEECFAECFNKYYRITRERVGQNSPLTDPYINLEKAVLDISSYVVNKVKEVLDEE